ncbi:uncharacterized protein LOC130051857 isoform X2 [Ostrea edulis]|uniref:uncharacterized protein LOC130051857 isoform X2 n=1 Tax=Ostrea edulis TaxID=37623 RepID=UPI0024AEF60C|nr:uncharacterized protein LOC130051857 isoform X2 [Ostrea edulis]
MQSITATVTIAFLVGLITRRAEDFMRSDDQLKLPDFQCMDHDLKTLRNDSVEIHVKAEKIEVKVNQLENNVSMVATTCALESQRLQDHGRCIDMYNRCKEDVNKYRDESRRKFNDTLDEVQKLRLEVQQAFKENTQQGQGRVLILMVVLGAGEFVLGVVLINGLRKLNALKTQTRPEDIKHGMKPDPNTLKGGTNLFNLKQKDSARLQKLVTIVSFNDGRQKAHKVMLEDITRNLQTEFLRISRKEEALQIKSQVTVLFVERNDRHIILESEQEIGDLKGK